MKTAMQELIDYVNEIWSNEGWEETIIHKANELLEKEKEQIQKAFSDGQETPINHPTLPHYSREEYYIDNFIKKELIVVDFDKVQKEWIEEANGMTYLEKAKYYNKKIQENENR